MNETALHKEALRQQMLMRALWRDARPGVVGGWLRDGARFERGLAAYQANAGALAERALGAAFPTVQQLVGDESFGAVARAFWRAEAPRRGDMATWGADFAAFIEADAQLAAEPYLADVARVDWAVHAAEQAADTAPPAGLERLATAEPARLHVRLHAGTMLIVSAHPVATIWLAHRSDAVDRFDPVREAFAERRAEAALVRRRGLKAEVRCLSPAAARFTSRLLEGDTLAAALEHAGADFEFEPWLIDALQAGAVAAVTEDHP